MSHTSVSCDLASVRAKGSADINDPSEKLVQAHASCRVGVGKLDADGPAPERHRGQVDVGHQYGALRQGVATHGPSKPLKPTSNDTLSHVAIAEHIDSSTHGAIIERHATTVLTDEGRSKRRPRAKVIAA